MKSLMVEVLNKGDQYGRQIQAKSDDRSDNVEKLQETVQDTIENIEEAHDTMEYSSGEEKENIKEKNKRREQAIEGMRQEIKDEHDYNQRNQ